ncbi:Hypothetical protein LUCI_0233 [Lucifera butyrica]|uniref:Uncharacterized protein n=1 Tax=Lucifera butyrica TaxID=1351585 RepID=A0A498R2I6_9FIRM|nr:UPF0280 family protein [Lucifera butyrica]VBB05027.1 Hypothetical protein LUCI_0233 [Lucifera butyrica]
MTFQPRTYRRLMKTKGLTSFAVTYKETDLWLSLDNEADSPQLALEIFYWLKEWRQALEAYIAENPAFLTSLEPLPPDPEAPELAQKMLEAAVSAGVGPMAAVAGAFAQAVGERLLQTKKVTEVLVENGGDIYLNANRELTVGIYAGASPLSQKVGLKLHPAGHPLGVCTSAGTVGPSLSLGNADAVVILSSSPVYADAYATTLGNLVGTPADIPRALELAPTLPQLTGAVIIAGDQLGAWGDVHLVPLQ